MLRAIALAARLDFTIEPSLLAAIRTHRHEIAQELDAAAARGVLQDPARRFVGEGVPRARRRRAARADFDGAARRRRRPALAVAGGARRLPPAVRLDAGDADQRHPARESAGPAGDLAPPAAAAGRATGDGAGTQRGRRSPASVPKSPAAPSAQSAARRFAAGAPRHRALAADHRRLQRRLKDLAVSPRAQRALAHRRIFRDALTWMEIHGGAPETVDHWKAMLADRAAERPGRSCGENAPPSAQTPPAPRPPLPPAAGDDAAFEATKLGP